MSIPRRRHPKCLAVALTLAVAGTAAAQSPSVLTLAAAQQIALQNHPRIASVSLTAKAFASVVKEVQAARYPLVFGNVTAVGAEHGTTLSAGAIPTSSLYSRGSSGVAVNQLVTDFGRTANLEQSARLRNQVQNQNVVTTRAEILLEVQEAYYQAGGAVAVLKVAQDTLDFGRLTLRQVNALAAGALRSTLDVSFAEVTVSEEELALVRAEDDASASHARLSAALGYERDQPFTMAEEPLPAPLEADSEPLISKALAGRPDLAALKLSRDAAQRFAEAEKKLSYPTVSVGGVAGEAPVRDDRLQRNYSAAGVNVSIPILNGGLFGARKAESQLRAEAAAKDIETLAVQIARDVRIAWLSATDAFRRLSVTAKLVDQAARSLRLAQARYNSGLGSIVELDQAALSQTSAQIAAASAKYEYLSRRADLDFTTGDLR
jgi:outer membrane protein